MPQRQNPFSLAAKALAAKDRRERISRIRGLTNEFGSPTSFGHTPLTPGDDVVVNALSDISGFQNDLSSAMQKLFAGQVASAYRSEFDRLRVAGFRRPENLIQERATFSQIVQALPRQQAASFYRQHLDSADPRYIRRTLSGHMRLTSAYRNRVVDNPYKADILNKILNTPLQNQGVARVLLNQIAPDLPTSAGGGPAISTNRFNRIASGGLLSSAEAKLLQAKGVPVSDFYRLLGTRTVREAQNAVVGANLAGFQSFGRQREATGGSDFFEDVQSGVLGALEGARKFQGYLPNERGGFSPTSADVHYLSQGMAAAFGRERNDARLNRAAFIRPAGLDIRSELVKRAGSVDEIRELAGLGIPDAQKVLEARQNRGRGFSRDFTAGTLADAYTADELSGQSPYLYIPDRDAAGRAHVLSRSSYQFLRRKFQGLPEDPFSAPEYIRNLSQGARQAFYRASASLSPALTQRELELARTRGVSASGPFAQDYDIPHYDVMSTRPESELTRAQLIQKYGGFGKSSFAGRFAIEALGGKEGPFGVQHSLLRSPSERRVFGIIFGAAQTIFPELRSPSKFSQSLAIALKSRPGLEPAQIQQLSRLGVKYNFPGRLIAKSPRSHEKMSILLGRGSKVVSKLDVTGLAGPHHVEASQSSLVKAKLLAARQGLEVIGTEHTHPAGVTGESRADRELATIMGGRLIANSPEDPDLPEGLARGPRGRVYRTSGVIRPSEAGSDVGIGVTKSVSGSGTFDTGRYTLSDSKQNETAIAQALKAKATHEARITAGLGPGGKVVATGAAERIQSHGFRGPLRNKDLAATLSKFDANLTTISDIVSKPELKESFKKLTQLLPAVVRRFGGLVGLAKQYPNALASDLPGLESYSNFREAGRHPLMSASGKLRIGTAGATNRPRIIRHRGGFAVDVSPRRDNQAPDVLGTTEEYSALAQADFKIKSAEMVLGERTFSSVAGEGKTQQKKASAIQRGAARGIYAALTARRVLQASVYPLADQIAKFGEENFVTPALIGDDSIRFASIGAGGETRRAISESISNRGVYEQFGAVADLPYAMSGFGNGTFARASAGFSAGAGIAGAGVETAIGLHFLGQSGSLGTLGSLAGPVGVASLAAGAVVAGAPVAHEVARPLAFGAANYMSGLAGLPSVSPNNEGYWNNLARGLAGSYVNQQAYLTRNQGDPSIGNRIRRYVGAQGFAAIQAVGSFIPGGNEYFNQFIPEVLGLTREEYEQSGVPEEFRDFAQFQTEPIQVREIRETAEEIAKGPLGGAPQDYVDSLTSLKRVLGVQRSSDDIETFFRAGVTSGFDSKSFTSALEQLTGNYGYRSGSLGATQLFEQLSQVGSAAELEQLLGQSQLFAQRASILAPYVGGNTTASNIVRQTGISNISQAQSAQGLLSTAQRYGLDLDATARIESVDIRDTFVGGLLERYGGEVGQTVLDSAGRLVPEKERIAGLTTQYGNLLPGQVSRGYVEPLLQRGLDPNQYGNVLEGLLSFGAARGYTQYDFGLQQRAIGGDISALSYASYNNPNLLTDAGLSIAGSRYLDRSGNAIYQTSGLDFLNLGLSNVGNLQSATDIFGGLSGTPQEMISQLAGVTSQPLIDNFLTGGLRAARDYTQGQLYNNQLAGIGIGYAQIAQTQQFNATVRPIQDEQQQLSYQGTLRNYNYSLERLELSRGFTLEQEGINSERLVLQQEYQLFNLDFNRSGQLLRRDYQQQQRAYSDQLNALNFDYAIEDINEAIRFSSGRDRRRLLTRRDRLVETRNIQEDAREGQREYQDQVYAREDEQYQKRREYIEALMALDNEQYDLSIEQSKEYYKLQKESILENIADFKKQHELQSEIIEAQRENQDKQIEFQKQQLGIQAENTRLQREYAELQKKVQEAFEDTKGEMQQIANNDQAKLVLEAVTTMLQTSSEVPLTTLALLHEMFDAMSKISPETVQQQKQNTGGTPKVWGTL